MLNVWCMIRLYDCVLAHACTLVELKHSVVDAPHAAVATSTTTSAICRATHRSRMEHGRCTLPRDASTAGRLGRATHARKRLHRAFRVCWSAVASGPTPCVCRSSELREPGTRPSPCACRNPHCCCCCCCCCRCGAPAVAARKLCCGGGWTCARCWVGAGEFVAFPATVHVSSS